MGEPSKKVLLTSLNLLIAGIEKRFASSSLMVAGQSYTGATLVSALQPLVDALSGSATAKAAYQKAIADERQVFAQAESFVTCLHQAIYASFGQAADALADFGLAPHTRRVPSVAVKAAAAAKAKATKAARGEIGKRQRAKIEATAPAAGAPASTSVTNGGSAKA